MIDSGKIVRFSVFIASAAFLYANADQSAENQIDIVPEWGLASLNMPQDDFMKNKPGFKTIMKGKNVNSALAIKNRPDDFWDIALCYINQNKVFLDIEDRKVKKVYAIEFKGEGDDDDEITLRDPLKEAGKAIGKIFYKSMKKQ